MDACRVPHAPTTLKRPGDACRALGAQPAVLFVAALAALLALGCGGSGREQPAGVPAAPPAYLALGDSLALGAGASGPSSTYVALVYAHLREAPDLESLVLVNLGEGGATTASMREEDGQLSRALAELAARNGNEVAADDVRLVTLSIGGNDAAALFAFCSDGLSPICAGAIDGVFSAFRSNFDAILGELRAAAGPETPIIAMAYYNALANPGCRFNPFLSLGDAVLEGAPALGRPEGLNDAIKAIAAAHDVRVANLYGHLDASQVQADCLHANDDGHRTIAERFIAAFER